VPKNKLFGIQLLQIFSGTNSGTINQANVMVYHEWRFKKELLSKSDRIATNGDIIMLNVYESLMMGIVYRNVDICVKAGIAQEDFHLYFWGKVDHQNEQVKGVVKSRLSKITGVFIMKKKEKNAIFMKVMLWDGWMQDWQFDDETHTIFGQASSYHELSEMNPAMAEEYKVLRIVGDNSLEIYDTYE